MIRLCTVRGTSVNVSVATLILICVGLVFEMVQCILVAFISLILHELCHTLMAAKLGILVLSVDILPFGFTARLENAHIPIIDEIKIALCGPIFSITVGCIAAAFSHFLGVSSKLVDEFVVVNISIGVINLLPSVPLDGGRVLSAILRCFMRPKNALNTCFRIGVLISAAIIILFVYLALHGHMNVTLAMFGVFLLIYAIRYRTTGGFAQVTAMLCRTNTLSRGKELGLHFFALDESVFANTAVCMMNMNKYNVVYVIDRSLNSIGKIDEGTLCSALAACPNITLGEIVKKSATQSNKQALQ